MMDLSSFKRILSFFAHPDDQTLAAAGALSRPVAMGSHVHMAIPATDIHSRQVDWIVSNFKTW